MIDEVIMGCVIQAGLGQAPARQAAIKAGLPNKVICTTINKVCASGMKSVAIAAQNILLGDADVIIAGGMESMSNVPFYNMQQRWGNKYGDITLLDGLAKDGLIDVYDHIAMGNFADSCAKDNHISRQDQDNFAIQSYKKSQAASEQGFFKQEIIPVVIPQKKGEAVIIDKDEEPNKVNFDKIANLNPAFSKEGTVTAANASTMNDGAAALLLMSKTKATALGLKPIAIIKGFADAEQDPRLFTTSPALALPKALRKAGIEKEAISYFEFNEAFSVVGLVNTSLLNLDPTKVNVHGGAVSLGHPLGCSGARILVTLIHILQKNKAQYGAAAICNGGGGASAMVIESC
jgi:acetyl-CoA C-acetyltransferase